MPPKSDTEFFTQVRAPANIAWVKYWGKKGPQLPANPSLSMTLKECATLTELSATPATQLKVELFFDGAREESFEAKTAKYIESVGQLYPALNSFHYRIETQNTFPHSSGIASSASSQAALALALSQLLRSVGVNLSRHDVGSMARLGSGSACRSLEGGLVVWGETEALKESSDLYATRLKHGVHPEFASVRDTIMVVSSEVKEVSSRAGHGHMNEHPFKAARYRQANQNFSDMLEGLKAGDWQKVGELMETEALSLHAMLMTGGAGHVLLAPGSLEIIRLVRLFRKESGLPLYFTIDAGPNIHLMYPESAWAKVDPFIRHELLRLTEKGQSAIWDSMGEQGAV